MKLLVTGASGFLGRHVVAEALARGHRVRAVVRPGSEPGDAAALGGGADGGGGGGGGIELARVDLRSRAGLADAVRGVDAVLHLAASKAGDMYAQYAGTVVATENLLAAMEEAGVRRIISVSSFSVYDYIGKRSWSVLDEESPLVKPFPPRDEYSHTKLVQENLVREAAQRLKWDFAVLRPGVIYGPDNLWTARLGAKAGDERWLRIGWWARLPLCYVEHCADSILLAAEKPGPLALTVNLVDDAPPTQARYAGLVRSRMTPRPRVVTIPWTVMRATARLAALVNAGVFGGRAKLPAILVPAKLHARFKPLRYSNRRLREELGWRPRRTLEEALDRSTGRISGRAVSPGPQRSEPAPPELASSQPSI